MAFGRFSRPLSTLALLVVVGFAGCSDPAPAPLAVADDVVTVIIPPEAYDEASGGPWYVPSTRDLTTPTTLHWVNQDIALHRVLAYWEPLQETPPMWVQTAMAAAQGHSHGAGGGHDHSAVTAGQHQHNGTPVFDITIEAGQTLDLPFNGEGRLMVHCHPHPWMVTTLDFVPEGPRSYAVNISTLLMQGASDGVTAEGQATELEWDLGSNVLNVSARLEWNDAEDDPNGTPDLNKPDTLGLELVAPDGTVVATSQAQAREGRLAVSYAVPHPEVPTAVTGSSYAEARQNLSLQWPDWREASGAWKLRVSVLTAPGVADNASLPAVLPGADGGQAWKLLVEARHAWGTLGASQETPIPSNPR